MNKKSFLIATGVCCLGLIILVLLWISAPQEPAQPQPITQQISDRYLEAVNKLECAQDLTMSVNAVKHTTVGSETFIKNVTQAITCNGLGSDDLLIASDETVTIGTTTMQASDIFIKDTLYTKLNDACFSGAISAESYLATRCPAVLLDITAYQDITYTENDGTITLLLKDPVAPEGWSLPDGAQMLNASGQAILDSNHNLLQSTYTIQYTYGNSQVWLNINSAVTLENTPQIEAPDPAAYVPLSSVQAPRLLEIACGYLTQATNIEATSVDTIDCKAGGLKRSQSITLNTYGTGETLSATLNSNVNLTEYSKAGETSVSTQSIIFENGVYTVSTDGAEPVAQPVTSDQMRSYCQNILVAGILRPEHISNAQITPQGDTLLLCFTANEQLAELICQNSCQTLYQNPTLLHGLASSYVTNTIQCSLILDSYTWMPIQANLNYSGCHTIEQIEYLLNVTYEQFFQLGSTPEASE